MLCCVLLSVGRIIDSDCIIIMLDSEIQKPKWQMLWIWPSMRAVPCQIWHHRLHCINRYSVNSRQRVIKFEIFVLAKQYLTSTSTIYDVNKKAFNAFCGNSRESLKSALSHSYAFCFVRRINKFYAHQIIFSGIYKYGKKPYRP